MTQRPPTIRRPQHHYRKRAFLWTDAAGASRGLAAVLYIEGQFYYCATSTPAHVWEQLIPRWDNQIGFQEMLAVVLGLCTFVDIIRDSLLLTFVDNDGVRVAIQRGGNRAAEVSHLVHHSWALVAQSCIGWYTARVESHANVADAPSRGSFTQMAALRAIPCDPVWPYWAQHLWNE